MVTTKSFQEVSLQAAGKEGDLNQNQKLKTSIELKPEQLEEVQGIILVILFPTDTFQKMIRMTCTQGLSPVEEEV